MVYDMVVIKITSCCFGSSDSQPTMPHCLRIALIGVQMTLPIKTINPKGKSAPLKRWSKYTVVMKVAKRPSRGSTLPSSAKLSILQLLSV